jgi:hypothetical protein
LDRILLGRSTYPRDRFRLRLAKARNGDTSWCLTRAYHVWEKEESALYEKDGEKYFVVDGHVHFWNASPENWIEGQEEYAKGWIECFYAYHKLGPEEYYWPIEKFQKYSE